jgi:hypothetical protein
MSMVRLSRLEVASMAAARRPDPIVAADRDAAQGASLRTRCRSGGGLPLMSRSITNSALIRSTASIAIGALRPR